MKDLSQTTLLGACWFINVFVVFVCIFAMRPNVRIWHAHENGVGGIFPARFRAFITVCDSKSKSDPFEIPYYEESVHSAIHKALLLR